MEPTGSTIAGMSAETAPISSAGMVLSQPPIRTTESSGSALTISSTSIDIRLRSSIELGNEKASCSEMVGNTKGRPPASRTPRAIASATCGAVLWQGLKSEAVERMPTIGRSSASSVKPAPLRKPRRRNSANSSSPYWARRDRNPFFIMNPDRTQLAAAGCVARENSGRHSARSGRCAQLAKISGMIGVFFDDVDHLRAVIARLDPAMTLEGMTPAQNVPARTGDVRAGLSDRCRVDGGRSIDRIWATPFLACRVRGYWSRQTLVLRPGRRVQCFFENVDPPLG